MVLRRCRALLKDEHLARDAMHDVFVQLMRHRGRLEDRGLSSLLYRMATNLSLNRIRTTKRHPETPDEELLHRIAGADDVAATGLARTALERIFGREPESTRIMAVMHLVDGMTHAEVAREMGMSVSGVRKRLRTLRTKLSELEDGLP
jgi:RNA polymerase sigma-70 factor (ECF subfamily)